MFNDLLKHQTLSRINRDGSPIIPLLDLEAISIRQGSFVEDTLLDRRFTETGLSRRFGLPLRK